MRIDDRPLRLDDLFLHQREPVLADLHRFVPFRSISTGRPRAARRMVADRRADASAPAARAASSAPARLAAAVCDMLAAPPRA